MGDTGKSSPGGREIFTGESLIPQRGLPGHQFFALISPTLNSAFPEDHPQVNASPDPEVWKSP